MGQRFGQSGSPLVSVHPFLEMDLQQPTPPAAMPQTFHVGAEEVQVVLIVTEEDSGNTRIPTNVEPTSGYTAAPTTSQADTSVPSTGQTGTSGLSRRPRQTKYRSRPLAPLDEARRILSQVEIQRAAADAANARAFDLIGQNIGQAAQNIGLVAENIGQAAQNIGQAAQNIGLVAENIGQLAQNIGRLSYAAENYLSHIGLN